MLQQLAHHTINGCDVKIGDLLASGTISGQTKEQWGSMLEISHNGQKAIPISENEKRTYIEDGDTVTLRGYAEKNGIRVGFGQTSNKIKPALP